MRDEKLQQLRDESSGKGGSKVDGSPLIQLMNDMESSMTSLSADNHLFAAELPRSQEKFGYVFTPITEVTRLSAWRSRHGPLTRLLFSLATAISTL